eukprot:g275.t1
MLGPSASLESFVAIEKAIEAHQEEERARKDRIRHKQDLLSSRGHRRTPLHQREEKEHEKSPQKILTHKGEEFELYKSKMGKSVGVFYRRTPQKGKRTSLKRGEALKTYAKTMKDEERIKEQLASHSYLRKYSKFFSEDKSKTQKQQRLFNNTNESLTPSIVSSASVSENEGNSLLDLAEQKIYDDEQLENKTNLNIANTPTTTTRKRTVTKSGLKSKSKSRRIENDIQSEKKKKKKKQSAYRSRVKEYDAKRRSSVKKSMKKKKLWVSTVKTRHSSISFPSGEVKESVYDIHNRKAWGGPGDRKTHHHDHTHLHEHALAHLGINSHPRPRIQTKSSEDSLADDSVLFNATNTPLSSFTMRSPLQSPLDLKKKFQYGIRKWKYVRDHTPDHMAMTKEQRAISHHHDKLLKRAFKLWHVTASFTKAQRDLLEDFQNYRREKQMKKLVKSWHKNQIALSHRRQNVERKVFNRLQDYMRDMKAEKQLELRAKTYRDINTKLMYLKLWLRVVHGNQRKRELMRLACDHDRSHVLTRSLSGWKTSTVLEKYRKLSENVAMEYMHNHTMKSIFGHWKSKLMEHQTYDVAVELDLARTLRKAFRSWRSFTVFSSWITNSSAAAIFKRESSLQKRYFGKWSKKHHLHQASQLIRETTKRHLRRNVLGAWQYVKHERILGRTADEHYFFFLKKKILKGWKELFNDQHAAHVISDLVTSHLNTDESGETGSGDERSGIKMDQELLEQVIEEEGTMIAQLHYAQHLLKYCFQQWGYNTKTVLEERKLLELANTFYINRLASKFMKKLILERESSKYKMKMATEYSRLVLLERYFDHLLLNKKMED